MTTTRKVLLITTILVLGILLVLSDSEFRAQKINHESCILKKDMQIQKLERDVKDLKKKNKHYMEIILQNAGWPPDDVKACTEYMYTEEKR